MVSYDLVARADPARATGLSTLAGRRQNPLCPSSGCGTVHRAPLCYDFLGCRLWLGDPAIGPYEGRETGATALPRELLETFDENDVVVLGRYRGSFMVLALLHRHGVHVRTCLHQLRHSDFRRERRLGPGDHVITWTRPQRPRRMSPQEDD